MKERFFRRVVFWLALAAALGCGAALAEAGGACGDAVSWSLDDAGALTIRGTGAMADYAFSAPAPWGKGVRAVRIDAGVTRIGDCAFYGCKNLESASLPDGLVQIGNNAFQDCGGLTGISIPDSVTDIGYCAFFSCRSLADVRLPDGLTALGQELFSWCVSLESVRLPDSLTQIGASAFYECDGLTEIALPDGLTGIGDSAFFGCGGLTRVSVPEGVTRIGEAAFAVCGNLADVRLPDSLTALGDSAFSGCGSLTELTLPDGLKTIGNFVFSGCGGLTEIALPGGVTFMGNYVFSGCGSLTRVVLADGLTGVNDHTFAECEAIRCTNLGSDAARALGRAGYSFRLPGGADDVKYHFADGAEPVLELVRADKSIVSFAVPDCVTRIGSGAFADCTGLTSVSIPAHVTQIGSGAFARCTDLTGVTILSEAITIEDGAFSGCGKISRVCFFGDTATFGRSIFGVKPRVYCHAYSDADYWAVECGYSVFYLDGVALDDIRTVTLPADFRLAVGEARGLRAAVFPNDGAEIAWSCSDPEVVSLTDGVATARRPGTATLTATVGGASARVTITVYAAVTAFELNEAEVWLVARERLRLMPVDIRPAGAEVAFTWQSGDETLATVDADGLVTTQKPGDVTVTAISDNGIRRGCVLHICNPVTAIEFAPAAQTLPLQRRERLTANVTTRTQVLVNHLVTFTSSDEGVASVDADGVVTPRGTGVALIRATAASGVTAVCEVTVCERSVLTLPADLAEIGSEAFAGLPALDGVRVPAGVAAIAGDAFAGVDATFYAPAGSYAARWALEHGLELVEE